MGCRGAPRTSGFRASCRSKSRFSKSGRKISGIVASLVRLPPKVSLENRAIHRRKRRQGFVVGAHNSQPGQLDRHHLSVYRPSRLAVRRPTFRIKKHTSLPIPAWGSWISPPFPPRKGPGLPLTALHRLYGTTPRSGARAHSSTNPRVAPPGMYPSGGPRWGPWAPLVGKPRPAIGRAASGPHPKAHPDRGTSR